MHSYAESTKDDQVIPRYDYQDQSNQEVPQFNEDNFEKKDIEDVSDEINFYEDESDKIIDAEILEKLTDVATPLPHQYFKKSPLQLKALMKKILKSWMLKLTDEFYNNKKSMTFNEKIHYFGNDSEKPTDVKTDFDHNVD